MDPYEKELFERYGIPLPEEYQSFIEDEDEDASSSSNNGSEYPKAKKHRLAFERFSIVELHSDTTRRRKGMKLIVCEQSSTHYWVWASKKITGIKKCVCDVIYKNLSIDEALIKMGKKPYLSNPKIQNFLARLETMEEESAEA